MGFLALKRDLALRLEDASAEPLTIAELGHGESAGIEGFTENFAHSERYSELGFTAGTPVLLLRRALFGDPLVILVRGTRYALRKADAAGIRVKKLLS
jgi:ferrous iron transport protein A